MENHISVYSKMTSCCTILHRLKFFLPPELLRLIFYSIGAPYFNYESAIYSNGNSAAVKTLIMKTIECLKLLPPYTQFNPYHSILMSRYLLMHSLLHAENRPNYLTFDISDDGLKSNGRITRSMKQGYIPYTRANKKSTTDTFVYYVPHLLKTLQIYEKFYLKQLLLRLPKHTF